MVTFKGRKFVIVFHNWLLVGW